MAVSERADVVVIGGGIAGIFSAILCARAGLSVSLVWKGYGATAMSSGCMLTAGIPERLARMGVADPAAAVNVALNDFCAIMAGMGETLHITRGQPKRHLATSGMIKTAEVIPHAIYEADIESLRGKSVRLVGMRGMAEFRPAFLEKALLEALSGEIAISETILSPGILRRKENFTSVEIAHLLDDPAMCTRFLEDALSQVPAGDDFLIFPPIFGMEDGGRAYAMSRAAFLPVIAETVSGTPSTAGLRLQAALNRALLQAGVTAYHGKINGRAVKDRRVESITVTDKDDVIHLHADRFLLATGKAIGGGISHDGGSRETVFDLPVMVNDRPASQLAHDDLLDKSFTASQPWLLAGLRVNDQFQPLREDGRPAFTNLWAAGSLLDLNGSDGHGGNTLAFSLATARLAALSALEMDIS